MCCATAAQAGTIAASARTHSKKTAGTGAEGCIASQSPHSAAAKGDTGEAAMRRFSSDAPGPQQSVQRNGRTIAPATALTAGTVGSEDGGHREQVHDL